MIDCAPEIMSLTSDFDEDLVQVPVPLRTPSHGFGPPFPDLMREVSPEPVDPVTDRFMANVDTALVKQIFNIPQRQREADVHHDRKLDDFR